METIVSLVIGIIGLSLGAAFWALFLRLFTKLVSKFRLAYGRAFLIMLIVFIINTIVSIISGYIIFAVTGEKDFPRLDILISVFFVQAFLYAKMIKHPETGSIGLSKGFLISLYIILVDIIIVVILSIPMIWLYSHLLKQIVEKTGM